MYERKKINPQTNEKLRKKQSQREHACECDEKMIIFANFKHPHTNKFKSN